MAPGCAGGASARDGGTANLEELIRGASAFDGKTVTVRAGFLSTSGRRVLTSGFAESFPPQAIDPTISLDAELFGPCVHTAQHVRWAEAVQATGMFRYRAEGQAMDLEGARIVCLGQG